MPATRQEPANWPTSSASGTTIPPCPRCGHDLRATVEAGGNRCPECGWQFTAQDLALLGPSNAEGQPRTLKPDEKRIRGPWLLAAIIAGFIVIALAIVLIKW